MASLKLRCLDAHRAPLVDLADIDVVDTKIGETKARLRGVDVKKVLNFTGLPAGDVHAVRVYPLRHRPVELFAFALERRTAARPVDAYLPIDSERVQDVRFPEYADLSSSLTDVLDSSILEQEVGEPEVTARAGDSPGERLFSGLSSLRRAGLLNLFCKMTRTGIGGASAWSFVKDLYRIRGDRVFANVRVDFRDAVKTAVAAGVMEEVLGSLHTPPPGFRLADSFKSLD